MNRSIVAVSVFALLITSCSTQHSKVNEPATTPGEPSHSATKSPGHVGDTLDLTRADGSKVAVTLNQVINPATVVNDKGEIDKTYIAAKLTLTDTGKNAIEGDVNVNVSVTGSDDQTYAPDLNDVTECTNFESGAFRLGAGESATGCVVFALPHGITPTRVKYLPSAGFANDFGEWLVP